MSYKYGYGADGQGGVNHTEAFRNAVLANANRGGENVATGAIIGALLGAECGFSRLPKELVAAVGAKQHAMLEEDIERFVKASPFVQGAQTAATQGNCSAPSSSPPSSADSAGNSGL